MVMSMEILYYVCISILIATKIIEASDVCRDVCSMNQTCRSITIGHNCYYLFPNERRTWPESKTFCEQNGLSMAKVSREMLPSRFNLTELFYHPKCPDYDDVWLGGQAVDLLTWKYLNNTIAMGARYSSIQFSKDNLARCGSLQTNTLDFGTLDCFKRAKSICRFDPCQSGNRCFRLVTQEMSWFEARSNCLDLGGDLFFIKDGENQTPSHVLQSQIIREMKNFNTELHIGLRHRIWEWQDKTEILYTNWKENEPNTFFERCLMIYGDTGKWNDDWCHVKKLTLCQIDSFNSDSLTPKGKKPNSPNSITKTDTTVCYNQTFIVPALITLAVILAISLVLNVVLAVLFCRQQRAKTVDTLGPMPAIDPEYYTEPCNAQNEMNYEVAASAPVPVINPEYYTRQSSKEYENVNRHTEYDAVANTRAVTAEISEMFKLPVQEYTKCDYVNADITK